MPNWQNSDRRSRLPADWPKRRARVLRRDGHKCTHTNEIGARCLAPATDVDHVVHGDDHGEHNLTSLCRAHHAAKSSREGAQAAHARRRAIDARYRRHESHPGLL